VKFSEIVGHPSVVERLRRAVAVDRLPNTYLFAGPDGIGKYTTARALAAVLLCDAPTADACGACDGCASAARETHPDLVVVRVAEGGTEIKIDQVRELQRRLRLRPIRARRKIAILDEAHRLNQAAQHAMLKTLEEPPGAALLILVASNVAALLPTVQSRCQRVAFSPLDSATITRLLVDRCGVPEADAAAAAAFGNGSVSDALGARAELIERARQELLPLLADLPMRRHAELAALAQDWGRLPLPDLLLLLRPALGWYRRRLGTALAGETASDHRTVLAQLRVVYDAVERLRRNGHRQLTLDVMLLGLRDAVRR
jgi:DNA polymerase-3 subunit delta'